MKRENERALGGRGVTMYKRFEGETRVVFFTEQK